MPKLKYMKPKAIKRDGRYVVCDFRYWPGVPKGDLINKLYLKARRFECGLKEV